MILQALKKTDVIPKRSKRQNKFNTLVIFLVAFLLTIITTSKQNIVNASSNSLVYGDRSYTISAGLEEVYKPKENHSKSKFNLTNGEFYSSQVTLFGNLDLIWRPRNASFWFYADMYSSNTNEMEAGTFSYVSSEVEESDPSLAQQSFFQEGRFAVDSNGNGDYDDEEFLDITDGTIITLSGTSPNYTFSFELVLENGTTTSGSFSEEFPPV